MNYAPSEPPFVEDLLRSGKPFVPFSEFSVHDICDLSHKEANDWLERRLQEEKPFIIHGFDKLNNWDKRILSSKSLVDLSSSGSIPVRNCQTGRDVRMKLADLFQFQTDHTRSNNIRESLYAKDLQCPEEWVKALKAILPSSLQHLGSLDLFRVLPREIAPEVLMAYAGTQGSLCFSGSVALNLVIESKDRRSGSICFGTDRQSQTKYDAYMEELGKSSHTDWANVSIAQLRSANFPIYVTYQEPGDLIVYPSATSHQVWNIGPMVTRVVWNVMHTSSMASFFDYIQPAYQRQCHTDTGRVPLIPLHALRDPTALSAKELKLLLEIFERLVDDDDAGSNVTVKLVDTQGAMVECRNHWVFWRELRQMLDDSLWNGFAICAETTIQCGKASHAPSALHSSASVSKEKPVRARIKPADPRGRVMGFVDNVFDQKRGKRASAGPQVAPSQMAVSLQGRKRPRSNSSEGFEQGLLDRSRVSSMEDAQRFGIVRSESDGLRSRDTAQPNIHLAKMHPYGNSWPKGQLRICDLVESRAESAAADGSSRNHTTQYQPAALPEIPNGRDHSPREDNYSLSSTSTSASEESIPVLEKRLEALRRYADDLLELSLVESHAKLLEKIAAYETQIEQIRRRKAERLFSNLNRDFPDLANVAMEEARRRGL
ncbi:hypothetical protein CNMCM8980_004149 [Aspergillus fumigatiaffinis]|uniref:JmjC domain-containing protein n=1 Tax=Aspergillus fumigatiaffinis TaxID=340414 RepID=A0A8H4H2X7_9EURO|nr:hypothetical protein CNMCM5878_007673 [Aspergillus fumigatiaffinis]KAF4233692.1 hypothetical protein CNMCM6457_004325 [Aspergillus fumigatiaffinis]KAF4239505.1 hypothetical protein CNMCM6805_005716 [Aspergillus fumigatiaffinis]KAF4249193.1 hypothetical protein CNMCM8980_004149 [Aspergillus fumigatiaffinis]